jgi:hypothetical protein
VLKLPQGMAVWELDKEKWIWSSFLLAGLFFCEYVPVQKRRIASRKRIAVLANWFGFNQRVQIAVESA